MISRASFRARPSCLATSAQSAWMLPGTLPSQARNWALSSAKVRAPNPRPVVAEVPSREPAGYVVVVLGATPVSVVVGGHKGTFPTGPTPLREVVKIRRRILAAVAGMKVGALLEPPCSWAKLQGRAPPR